MTFKRVSVLLGAILVVLLLVIWSRSRDDDYVNAPPSIDGPWVAFGDSLTEGQGAAEGNNYPALLSGRLGVPILNKGKSGDTTSDALNRLDEILELRPRVVLLCLGGNDSLNQDPRTRTFANLSTIIDRL